MDPQQMDDDQLQKALGLTYNAQKRAEKDYKELQREWRKRHGSEVGNEYAAVGVQVFLTPNHRWDEATAREVLTASGLSDRMISKLEVTTIDRKKAEETLPPDLYAKCQKASAPKFNIRFT